MGKLNIFIFCCVSNNELRHLLNYQKDMLIILAYFLNINVISIVKEISDSKSFNTKGMQSLIYYITKQKINVLTIYNQTRLYICSDLYAEFQMMCDRYNVEIMIMKDLKLVRDVYFL